MNSLRDLEDLVSRSFASLERHGFRKTSVDEQMPDMWVDYQSDTLRIVISWEIGGSIWVALHPLESRSGGLKVHAPGSLENLIARRKGRWPEASERFSDLSEPEFEARLLRKAMELESEAGDLLVGDLSRFSDAVFGGDG